MKAQPLSPRSTDAKRALALIVRAVEEADDGGR
jgi:hypothetical protein